MSSSFGQTYFISIFAGEIRGSFSLSHGQWGLYYTIGTLSSAALMLYAGGLTDRYRVRRLAPVILAIFASVCLAMAANPLGLLLIPIIFGLRFCGQGMLSHMQNVAVARWFARNRGRANAVMAMGFILGEAAFPILFVLMMGAIGWRLSWVVAAVLTLAFIPIFLTLLTRERDPVTQSEDNTQVGIGGRHWTRSDALGHWFFWVVAVGIMSPSMFGTAFFFQQVYFSEVKGWALESFVVLIPLYSFSAFLSLFVFGAIADRFGSGVVLSMAMVPGAICFWIFSAANGLGAAAIGMAVFGTMTGAMGAMGSTLWPEMYGTRHIGSVRSVASAIMVLGSALGPGITGYLIDFGVDYETQLLLMSMYFATVGVILLTAYLKIRPQLPDRIQPGFNPS